MAGGLLAFALSFDEVVVTLFTAGAQQTLPLWIYDQFKLPNTAPEANAVAVFVIALTAIPVYLAQRLMRDTGGIAGRYANSQALQPAAGFGSLLPHVVRPWPGAPLRAVDPSACGLGSAGRRRGRGDVGRPRLGGHALVRSARRRRPPSSHLAAIQHEAEERIEAYDAIHQKFVNTRNALASTASRCRSRRRT